MKDYLVISSTPSDEPYAQVGSPTYHKQMRLETVAFKNQMKRVHPEPEGDNDNPPAGFETCSFLPYYTVKAFPHDFGSYHEVCAIYDGDHEASTKWAYEAESHCPNNWDKEALKELAANNYKAEE